MNEQEYEHVNNKVFLGPLDSKAEPPPIRLFLQVLPNLQQTLNFPRRDGFSSYILFWESLGKSGIIGNPPIFFIYASLNGLVIFISLKKNDISGNNKILVYLIIQTVCLGVFFVPQENAFFASSTKLVSLLLWNQGITGGTKNSKMPD